MTNGDTALAPDSSQAPLPSDLGTIGFRPCSYDRRVFSPRVRALLPARYLRAAGFDARVVPPDGKGRYDCVVFQKAYDKRDLALARRVLDDGGRVVFDLCDNHFYNPSGDPALAARASRLRAMVGLADVVSASTAEIARLIDSKPTVVVDDAFEAPRFASSAARMASRRQGRRRRGQGPLRLVWQGQSGPAPSGMSPLARLVPLLEEIHSEVALRLTVISNSRDAFDRYVGAARFPVRYVRWRRSTFAWRLAANDLCLLPFDLNPFTICKSNNRAVLALMLGLPVVADDIPSYRPLTDWISIGNWSESIRAYSREPERAAHRVSEAQASLRSLYTPARVVAQWSQVFEALQ